MFWITLWYYYLNIKHLFSVSCIPQVVFRVLFSVSCFPRVAFRVLFSVSWIPRVVCRRSSSLPRNSFLILRHNLGNCIRYSKSESLTQPIKLWCNSIKNKFGTRISWSNLKKSNRCIFELYLVIPIKSLIIPESNWFVALGNAECGHGKGRGSKFGNILWMSFMDCPYEVGFLAIIPPVWYSDE